MICRTVRPAGDSHSTRAALKGEGMTSIFIGSVCIILLTVILDGSIILYMINATHNETGAEKMTHR